VQKEINTQVYQKVVRASLVYGSESWTLTKNNKNKIAEMRFLRRIKRMTKADRVKNETVVSKLNIKPIGLVIGERQLSWLGHMPGDFNRM
jgi:hypothetical protein